MDKVIPNFNPNLSLLRVWNSKSDGLGNTAEYPVIAWRLVEDDFPVPISTDGEHVADEVSAVMVFDRATQTGILCGENVHSREKCVQELHDFIEARRAKGGAK